MKDSNELVRELLGNVCQCGKTKHERQTFCRDCYYALTRQMRADLYKRMGEGYEEAYETAIEHLKGIAGRIDE